MQRCYVTAPRVRREPQFEESVENPDLYKPTALLTHTQVGILNGGETKIELTSRLRKHRNQHNLSGFIASKPSFMWVNRQKLPPETPSNYLVGNPKYINVGHVACSTAFHNYALRSEICLVHYYVTQSLVARRVDGLQSSFIFRRLVIVGIKWNT